MQIKEGNYVEGGVSGSNVAGHDVNITHIHNPLMENKKMPQKKTILVLAANTCDMPQLRLGREVNIIREALRSGECSEQFILKSELAITVDNLQATMLEHNPTIVHFCGHGSINGIVLKDSNDNAQLVSTEALVGLFGLFANTVKCVVLNACFTEIQAEAIIEHIPYVIGMAGSMDDESAIEFAHGFYVALAACQKYEKSYKFGCSQIRVQGLPNAETPRMRRKSDLMRQRMIQRKAALSRTDTSEIDRLKIEDSYSSFQPLADSEHFLRLKVPTTHGWIKQQDITSQHKIIANETYITSAGIKYQKIENEIFIIKDPIRPFETQIGVSRAQRPGGILGMIVMDENTTVDTFRTMYPHVLLSDEHRNWLAMVLAEIITDPDILEYMYKHPKTDQTVKKLISKNPFAPKEIQEHECLFCDTEFSRHREIKADDCAYIICNDYPYAPYFHYVAILRDPIHSWTELKLEHLKGMNKLIKDFLNQENKQNLGNSPGIEIGLNSSIRHLVLGKTTHSSAGASIAHVHKQICGVAPTSETLGDYLSKLCEIYNQHGIDYLGLYLDLLRSSGFIIWEDDNVALYVPFGQIAMDELQIMIKSEHGYLELTDDEISSFSKAEFLVTRLYCKLEINSFNEIMISKRFNSSAKNFRLIFTFITREIDLAISELSLVYIVDSHPEKTVEKVKDVWEAVKEECGSWVDDDQKKIAIN